MNITPETKIVDLLEVYPESERVITALSPAFDALKNPILRRTVAKVTSIRQVAAIAGISVEKMVNTIRESVGQSAVTIADEGDSFDLSFEPPKEIAIRYDARPMIASGQHPKDEILRLADTLTRGETMELTAPFVPTPIIDIFRNSGFKVAIAPINNGIVRTYITR